eukprot:gene58115-biopygen33527
MSLQGACRSRAKSLQGARPSGESFEKGPMVDNAAWSQANCQDWTGFFGEAMTRCINDPTCTTLHDHNGDSSGWRTYTIHREGADSFVQGPMVSNSAYKVANCGEPMTFGKAKQACSSQPTCTTLHDHNGDDNGWRACASTMEEDPGGAAKTYAIVRNVPAAVTCNLEGGVRWGKHKAAFECYCDTVKNCEANSYPHDTAEDDSPPSWDHLVLTECGQPDATNPSFYANPLPT